MAGKQISQGNSRDLPAYACWIYVTALRASIGLWQSLLPHPATPPLSASCSSGQHFASGFLQIRSRPRHPCLWLTLPLAGCVEDFHLQVVQSTTTVNRTAPVTALRAMPGAHRVGGGVTPAVLPHHRTYGSVYGGSCLLTNSISELGSVDVSPAVAKRPDRPSEFPTPTS